MFVPVDALVSLRVVVPLSAGKNSSAMAPLFSLGRSEELAGIMADVRGIEDND